MSRYHSGEEPMVGDVVKRVIECEANGFAQDEVCEVLVVKESKYGVNLKEKARHVFYDTNRFSLIRRAAEAAPATGELPHLPELDGSGVFHAEPGRPRVFEWFTNPLFRIRFHDDSTTARDANGTRWSLAEVTGTCSDRWVEVTPNHPSELATLRERLAAAEKKNAHSLANNLCPDHRDKQGGKPCLACEVESLERKLAAAERERDRLTALNDRYMQEIADGASEYAKACDDRDDLALRLDVVTRERDEAIALLEIAQREFCGSKCPSVKYDDKPWPHVPECASMQEAIDHAQKTDRQIDRKGTAETNQRGVEVGLGEKEGSQSEGVTLACGHPASLLVRSIETDFRFCRLCETQDRCRDALTMERSLTAERDAARAKLAEVRDALKYAGWFDAYPFRRLPQLIESHRATLKNEDDMHFWRAVIQKIDAALADGEAGELPSVKANASAAWRINEKLKEQVRQLEAKLQAFGDELNTVRHWLQRQGGQLAWERRIAGLLKVEPFEDHEAADRAPKPEATDHHKSEVGG